jgi:hypothetical protein
MPNPLSAINKKIKAQEKKIAQDKAIAEAKARLAKLTAKKGK